jgi:GTP-binding protein Era
MSDIKCGYVAIIGKPNAGKSTLMNSIVGAKLSIVTPKPQTTRKKVLGIFSDEKSQLVFIDTPGLLNPRYGMQKKMMEYVDSALESADAVLYIIDCFAQKDGLDQQSLTFLDAIKHTGKPIVALLNKIDLFKDVKDTLPIIASLHSLGIFTEIVPAAALKNANTQELIGILVKYMPEQDYFYDPELLSIQNERFFVSEMIREQVFKCSAEEIPYSTEIAIAEFKERETGKWYISADIIVERKSQKIILIGEKGAKIKQIGEKARLAIEEHLEMPVYLELFVKVRPKWRDNENMLKSFGY